MKKLEKDDKTAKVPPKFVGKMDYLYYVGAEDCVKMEQQWKQGFQMVKPIIVTKQKKGHKEEHP